MFESISCASRGKVTVAYSLLRKPLKETLAYIEWLVADCEDFYETFRQKNTNEYDVTNSRIFTKEKLSYNMEVALQKTYTGDSINVNNIVHDLRFNSEEDISLERIWNRAMHLVTNRKSYETERTNLNFIFADDEIWNEHWNYYYLVLPQIMAYVLEVCEVIFIESIDIEDLLIDLNRKIRLAKYSTCYPNRKPFSNLKTGLKEFAEFGIEEKAFIVFSCSNCDDGYRLKPSRVNEVSEEWNVKCDNCGEIINLSKFHHEISIKKIVFRRMA